MVEGFYPIPQYQEAVRKAGETVLADCAATARDTGVVFNTKLAVVETMTQRISDLINDEAGQWPADLIVIGTHGRRGFNHLVLGSAVEGVIRLANKPVLIIRTPPTH